MSDVLQITLGGATGFVPLAFGETITQWLGMSDGSVLQIVQSDGVVDAPPVVENTAPAISVVQSLATRTLTVTATVTGTPTPSVSIVLTANGTLVSPSGSNPWTYAASSSASDTTLAWVVQANNLVGNASQSGSTLVPSDLVVPTVETSGEVSSRTVTVTAVATGTPTPSLSIVMTNNGTTVSPTGTNPWSYTAPSSFDFSFIEWNVTATNTAGAVESEDNSASIDPDQFVTPPAAPVLSGTLAIDATTATGVTSLSIDKVSQLYWGLYASDSLSTDPQTAGPLIAAGTGALDFGSIDVTGSVALNIAFASGISEGSGTIYFVGRDLSEDPNFSDWSNVLKNTAVEVVTEGWSITVGSATATIASYPAVKTTPSWSISTGNTTATINSYPGEV